MKQSLFLLAFAMLLFSCTKKEASVPATNPISPPAPTYSVSDYSKLNTGNYWVYEIVNVDTLNNITATGMDSCYIKGDSVINGNSYAIAVNMPPALGTQLLRDSSSFLVDRHGNILFTLTDFNTALFTDSLPNIAKIQYSVPLQQCTVIVPMGTYLCYDDLGTVTFSPSYKWGHIRYANNYYAPKVGLVCATTFYINLSGTTQYWLVRAHVQ
jgi:hypothetical protein